MISDFHLHTDFSGDCDIPARVQIEKAVSLGMTELCITDHHDYGTEFADTNFTLDTETYFCTMQRLQQEYQDQIRLNIGVELGLQLHISDYLNQYEKHYPFDFIIGSSHFIDRMDPYYPEYFIGRTEENAYEHYFDVTLHRIRSLNCFDVFGHLDYIVRYGPERNRNYSFAKYQEYLDPILKALIERGKGLECNTGGFKYHLGQPNPAGDVLARYRALGGEILTVGSDAHDPQYLGYCFPSLIPLLTSCGFRYYTVFRNRKPEFIPLG